VTETGYGISYIIRGEDNGKITLSQLMYKHVAICIVVNFSIHSKKSCPSTDSTHMLEQIKKAMNEMKELYNL